ncbi:hypothetical protein Vadar_007787 [Vaccinium darrowii]|uniref:Uncharacterized protein n=1 Tax=Vaccinium darrowii TaxID=229202 RepID=A0ACB7ZC98_9ERIC|nr:hypothetical protein Vadar_007787 [Vaccinium darrowii]
MTTVEEIVTVQHQTDGLNNLSTQEQEKKSISVEQFIILCVFLKELKRHEDPQNNTKQDKTNGRISTLTVASELDAKLCLHVNSVGGGLELLCESVKIHNVNVDPAEHGGDKLTMKSLLAWVRTNLIKERPEMFMKGDSVRPGVLVLVND